MNDSLSKYTNKHNTQQSSIENLYDNLESITRRIFKMSGYEIVEDCRGNTRDIDVIAKDEDKSFYIEVKVSTSVTYKNLSLIDSAIKRLTRVAEEDGAYPVLIVYSIVSKAKKLEYSSNSNLFVLDISNILHAVQETDLQVELVSCLPFSVEQVEPIQGNLPLGWLAHADKGRVLISQLEKCKTGKDGAAEFETICTGLLKEVFYDDLALWKPQQKSNRNIYRFDLLCRIKDNTRKTFWNMMENYFQSKYIVFEFKNYTSKITQSEIYTTEKYLYKKALRNVAVIVARNGFDDNSEWAAKGCLREEGKLIILITDDDLKRMYRLKRDKQDPSVFLLDKIDDMLTELEK